MDILFNIMPKGIVTPNDLVFKDGVKKVAKPKKQSKVKSHEESFNYEDEDDETLKDSFLDNSHDAKENDDEDEKKVKIDFCA